MRRAAWPVAAGLLIWSVAAGMFPSNHEVLLITGSNEGYLSPCGCVKPMSGGLRRRVTAVRQLTVKDKTTLIDTGGFVKANGRQDEMKAEATAETMGLVKVAAINFGLEEARLGAGMAPSLDRLSGGALIAGTLAESDLPVKAFKESGPFLIGGVDPRSDQLAAALGTRPRPVEAAVQDLLEEASASGLVPVLMTRGDLASSESLAKKFPKLRLIVCTVKSSPYEQPRRVGDTLIVTPGEHGKYVVKIEWDGHDFVAYKFYDLGPQYKNDPDAQEVYSSYLARVAREDLLSMVPRSESADFAGSAACARCHVTEARVWKESQHAHALNTLEKEGHDRDPDCVACHVVGLRSVSGFVSRAETPLLTDVGCESCHGPAKLHTMNPAKNKMAEVGNEKCVTCHTTENSPTFKFDEYWAKIKH